MARWQDIDAHLDPAVRRRLESRYWAPIEAAARLEVLRHDPSFLADPASHPALFADHGIVHVRDIAGGLIELEGLLDGVVLPHRPDDRRRFVLGCGILLTYLHDVGMADLTAPGRRVHAVVAAQLALAAELDDIITDLVVAGGAVVRRLAEVDAQAPFAVPVEVVLREVLALTMAHSKSTVPAPLLDDRTALARLLRRCVFADLDALRVRGRTPHPDDEDGLALQSGAVRHPDPDEAFAWLDTPAGPQAELADDVVDAVRLLRAADALRQRGTTLRTSGGYEIGLDATSGRAVYTLRSADGAQAFHVSYHDERGAGEANVKVAAMTPQGHLRIAFHRGSAGTPAALDRMRRGAAAVVADIAGDVVASFDGARTRRGLDPPAQTPGTMRVELERPGDGPDFVDDLVAAVTSASPELAGRVVAVADVESADERERERYHAAPPLTAGSATAAALVAGMADHGADVRRLDEAAAFVDARCATIERDEVLVAAGSPPSFVYVPFAEGLAVVPAGGYRRQPARPFVPIGVTGAVRRAERNAEIVATRALDVAMIPAARYVEAWFRPYGPEDLPDALGRAT